MIFVLLKKLKMKKNKLKENIEFLDDIFKTFEDTTNKLKNMIEKINEKKEELKIKIQKIFTKIRNAINEREDLLLLEVDKQFDNLFCNEEIIKESEILQIKLKCH